MATLKTKSCSVNLDASTTMEFYQISPCPNPWRQPFRAAYWLFELVFGLLSLFAFLAFLAAVPIVNFLALGYMLEAQGRVVRTGLLRSGFPLLPLAPRLGGIAAGIWCWWWVVRLLADAASDAALISPGSRTAEAWRVAVQIVVILVSIHICLAIGRGGRLRYFFWPTPLNGLWFWRRWNEGQYWQQAGDSVRSFLGALNIRYHFWLGLRGFIGAFAIVFFPTLVFSVLNDTSKPFQIILTLVGGAMLVVVLAWVPFLQAKFSAENRLMAMTSFKDVREQCRKAPIAFLLSTIVLYALSLPLYLFKLFEVPQDMRWMLTPLFIVSIYPAKLLIGWSYSWAGSARKTKRAWLVVRILCGLVRTALLAIYVFLLFFTPTVGAAGKAVLFQHHAILLPWPF